MRIRRNFLDPIDFHIGEKLRQARVLAGLSQLQLGKLFGVSFQQIQKNERGINRISASGLVRLAHILKVPLLYFYEGISDDVLNNAAVEGRVLLPDDPALLAQRDTLEFIRVYHRIATPEQRKKLLSFLKLAVERPDYGSK